MTTQRLTLRFTASQTSTTVARYSSVDDADAWDMIRQLGTGMNVLLAANLKACRLPLIGGLREEDDAYAEAPEAVRSDHSLHVFAADSIPDARAVIETLRQKGGLIVLFTKLDRAALMAELKFYWAWFARPATLRMQFEDGSEFLAEKLFSGLHAVLIEAEPGKGWIVYANPKNTPDWQAVGFPNPPIGGEG